MVIKNNGNIVGISVIAIQRINLSSKLRLRKDTTFWNTQNLIRKMAPETEAYQLETHIFHILKSIKRLRHGVRSKEMRVENIYLPFECCPA